MSQQPDNTNDRLERMLRRWGADEAAQAASPGPVPAARRRAVLGPVLRYSAVAAGTLLVASLAWVIIQPSASREGPAHGVAQTQPADERIARLDAQLATVRTELEQARGQLAQTKEALEAGRQQFERKLQLLREDFDGQKRSLLASFAKERQGLREALTRREGELAAAGKALTEAAAQRDDARRKLTVAATELARRSDTHARLARQRDALQSQLTAVRAADAAMLADFQRSYLAAAAPNEHGVVARQSASRRARMVERARVVRQLARTESTRQLVDRLEVLMLQLDLLNAADPRAARSFAQVVPADGLGADIEQALAGGGELPEVRSWLVEARLILTGVARAI